MGGATGFSKQTFFLFSAQELKEEVQRSRRDKRKLCRELQMEHRVADRRLESKIYTVAEDTITSTLMSGVGITATTIVEDEAGGPGEVVVTIPKAY